MRVAVTWFSISKVLSPRSHLALESTANVGISHNTLGTEIAWVFNYYHHNKLPHAALERMQAGLLVKQLGVEFYTL